ncbi:MAG: lysophospholipid acyltransferase family protein [Mariprofundus sp.]|nr:lysophospholipid acyltransferase family protein [Mariprofundus sp.]
MPRIIKKPSANHDVRRRALHHAHQHVVRYIKTLSMLRLISFEFIGTPIKESALIVANHPSLLDFIILMHDFPNAICLYKSQTRDNPILSDFVNIAGYIEGMDGTRSASKRIINECCERLGEGHHIALFPEGTRSKSNIDVARFRATAFHAALKSGVGIQPVAIYCEPLFLGKNQPWSTFSKARNRMVVEYMEPIQSDELPIAMQNARSLADLARDQIAAKLLLLHKKDHS